MEPVNLKFICRLCAKEDRFCIEVFGEDGKKNNISNKIRLCLPIVIRENDDYPKQICLSCLNKLDTSHELYSGCLSAQSTIKRIMTALNLTPSQQETLLPNELPLQQTNLIAQQLSSLTTSNPVVKAGPSFLMLIEKRTTEEPSRQSGKKVKNLHTQSSRINENDRETMKGGTEMGGNESDDDDDDNNNNNGDVDMGFDDNADQEEEPLQTSSAEQQNMEGQKSTSSRNTDPKQVKGMYTSTANSLTHSKSANSETVFEQVFGNTTNNVTLNAVGSVVPSATLETTGNNQLLVVHQAPQNFLAQPQVYIPNSVFGQKKGLLESLLADTPHLQTIEAQQQVNNTQAVNNTTRIVPANQANFKPVLDISVKKKTAPTLLIKKTVPKVPISSSSSPAKQQNVTNSGTVKTAVTTITNTATTNIGSYSKSLTTAPVNQKSTSNGNFNPVSGHSKKCKCYMCCKPQTTSVVSSGSGAISSTATTTSSLQLINNMTSATQSAGTEQVINATSGASEISPRDHGLGFPEICPGTSLLINSVASINPPNNFENSIQVRENIENIPVTSASSLRTLQTNPSLELNVTTSSNSTNTTTITNTIPTTTAADVTADSDDITFVDFQPGRNVQSHLCQYCNKYFPSDIIMHHKTLHFRERFFCCVACGKNFRTELGLETHRCDGTL